MSQAWEKLPALEEQIGRERQRLALLEAGLAAIPEVKTFESMQDLRESDARKDLVAKVESSRTEVDLMTKDAEARRIELEGFAKEA